MIYYVSRVKTVTQPEMFTVYEFLGINGDRISKIRWEFKGPTELCSGRVRTDLCSVFELRIRRAMFSLLYI